MSIWLAFAIAALVTAVVLLVAGLAVWCIYEHARRYLLKRKR